MAMRITFLVAIIFALLATSASAQSPQGTLAKQLKTELSGQSSQSCQLMTVDYQEMFSEAALVIGRKTDSCAEAVSTVRSFRVKRDKRIKQKSKRQVRAARKGRASYKDGRVVVSFSYRGSPPGWDNQGKIRSKESYRLIQTDGRWLVDRLLYTRAIDLN